ncbi:MAG TPA: glycoside hydrolase family 15 protein [bacterium]|jgi:oligosaccharide amylase
MPRDIPVGNGSLLINFDSDYFIRDIYYPHVGQENHTVGHHSRFGVWVDGKFGWVHDTSWEKKLRYAKGTLVTDVELRNEELGLEIVSEDCVDFNDNIFLRKISVKNLEDNPRDVRLFFAQDLNIAGNPVGDTAYYEPERRAVYHYKGHRWFLINCAKESPSGIISGINQWAVGDKKTKGMEGTWRDAENGQLSGNAVAQGSVDSCVALHLNLPKKGQTVGWYWIAVGNDFEEVTFLNRLIRQKEPVNFLERTRHYWKLWVNTDMTAGISDKAEICNLYERSLLVLRTQIDNKGAIIAANDFDYAYHFRDTYSYMWPRDGALVISALMEANYSMLSRNFFNFCRDTITDEGYLLHKYNPDGSLASSWHGWYADGKKQLPVQEDETALVIWALKQHFEKFKDVEYIRPVYKPVVKRGAKWMASYTDHETGLPLPSFDLWEERRGILAWTVGATWAGLSAAAEFCEAFGQFDKVEKYASAADRIKKGADRHLWREDLGRFLRMINFGPAGNVDADLTIDASVSGLWMFGMYDVNDERIVRTMESMEKRLWVKTDIGGIARYEGDPYHRIGEDTEQVPGNPWFICTLWLARYYALRAKNKNDLKETEALLEWTCRHAYPSGILSEQLHPFTGEPVSVSPLTWSHAAFVSTVHEYKKALDRIESGK